MQMIKIKYAALATVLLLSVGVIFLTHALSPKPAVLPDTPLTGLQLNQPFTLKYAAAAQQDFQDRRGLQDFKLQITLSYDGKNLLYRNEDLVTHVTHTILYDGHETYDMDSHSRIAEIEPGFNFDRMIFCPFPGTGVPYNPLLAQGFSSKYLPKFLKLVAPNQNSEPKYIDPSLYRTPNLIRKYGVFRYADRVVITHSPIYREGAASVVYVMASGIPKVLWYDTFDNMGPHLGTVWQFYGHEKFQGLWLATKIKMRWEANVFHKNVILQDATYHLESAVSHPLAQTAYDPVTYLPAYANISDSTIVPYRAFVYSRNKGTLQAQRVSGL